MALFHGGVTWRAFQLLVSPTSGVEVQTEKSMQVGSKRFVPDLIVRCRRTGRVLLVVEVWHSHAVTPRKKAAFNQAGLPWIEVLSWHVLARRRRFCLPVLDWGGALLPPAPEQFGLFEPNIEVCITRPQRGHRQSTWSEEGVRPPAAPGYTTKSACSAGS